VVQPNPTGEEGLGNVRWVQTKSPLFVVRKTNDSKMSSRRKQPPQTGDDPFLEDPNAKAFGASAFNLTQLDWNNGGKLLADAKDPESESPSFKELNETIVYADSMEEAARVDCCSISDVLKRFAQNCGIDSNFQRQTKEKAGKMPLPRRKNLLSRIRNKKKHPKDKGEYGNLIDHEDDEAVRGEMKGVRKAHVQLAYHNIRGKTTAKATQFTLLVNNKVCF
jgi:hypothetical protein